MDILVRLNPLVAPRTGIGHYTENLVRELLNEDCEVSVTGVIDNKYYGESEVRRILEAESCCPGGSSTKANDRRELLSAAVEKTKGVVRCVPGVYRARDMVRSWRNRQAARRAKYRVYHEPNYVPFDQDRPYVLTVHDLSHIRYPEFHPRERVDFLDRHLGQAMRQSARIIAVSEFTKSEILTEFPEMKGKVVSVLNGVSDRFRPRGRDETRATLARWGLEHGQYMLSVATCEPRKNLEGLIKAYFELSSELKFAFPLVLVGANGWKTGRLFSLIDECRRSGAKIILTGYLGNKDVADLTAGARVFAYPSYYEGFGLPIVEARLSGVPVVTSNFGAMREVAGGASILVDPDNIRPGLERALCDPPPPEDTMKLQSYFSWERAAKETVGVYRAADGAFG